MYRIYKRVRPYIMCCHAYADRVALSVYSVMLSEYRQHYRSSKFENKAIVNPHPVQQIIVELDTSDIMVKQV